MVVMETCFAGVFNPVGSCKYSNVALYAMSVLRVAFS